MTEQKIITVLKVFIVLGICLIATGHYLLVSDLFDEQNSIHGIIISAAFIAIGVLFSLPTKIYLTIVLMNIEAVRDKHV